MSASPTLSESDPSASGPDAGEAWRWGLFAASLLGLALLVGWSARHPVPAVAPDAAAPEPEAEAVAAVVVGPEASASAPSGDAVPTAPTAPTALTTPTAAPPAPVAVTGAGGDAALDGPGADPAAGVRGASASVPANALTVPAPSVPTRADGRPGARGLADGAPVAGRPAGTPAERRAARRAEELAVLVGLSGRLRYAPGEAFPGATGVEALGRMVEPLVRHPDLDVVVSVIGRELDEPARDAALARERAGLVIDRLVELGLDRGRFLLRLRPEVPGPTPGQHVRVSAVTGAG